MNSIYAFPYGQYGELHTRGPWLPSSVESALSAEVAKDILNLQNEFVKIESICANSSVSFIRCSSNSIHSDSTVNAESEISSGSQNKNAFLKKLLRFCCF